MFYKCQSKKVSFFNIRYISQGILFKATNQALCSHQSTYFVYGKRICLLCL